MPARADPPFAQRALTLFYGEPLECKSRYGFNIAVALAAGQASGQHAGKGSTPALGRKLSIAAGYGAVCLLDDLGSVQEGGGTRKWTFADVEQVLHMQFGSSQIVLGTGSQP